MPQAEKAKPLPTPMPDYPIPPAWIQSGKPQGRGLVMVGSADGLVGCGQWECTPGKFRWEHDVDEFIYLLQGEVVVTIAGQEPFTVQEGEMAFFPRGTVAQWDVKKTVRKVFFIRKGDGKQ